MKIRPLYDRVVVKRIEQQEQMHGGLYIPDSAKEKPQEGEVVAVGKGKRLEDGKVIALELEAASEQEARDGVVQMCEKLLRNPVIEDYRIDRVRATAATSS